MSPERDYATTIYSLAGNLYSRKVVCGGRERRGCVTNWPLPSSTSLGPFRDTVSGCLESVIFLLWRVGRRRADFQVMEGSECFAPMHLIVCWAIMFWNSDSFIVSLLILCWGLCKPLREPRNWCTWLGPYRNVPQSKNLQKAQILWNGGWIIVLPFVCKVRWVVILCCSQPGKLWGFYLKPADYLDCLRTGTLVTLKRDLP